MSGGWNEEGRKKIRKRGEGYKKQKERSEEEKERIKRNKKGEGGKYLNREDKAKKNQPIRKGCLGRFGERIEFVQCSKK